MFEADLRGTRRDLKLVVRTMIYIFKNRKTFLNSVSAINEISTNKIRLFLFITGVLTVNRIDSPIQRQILFVFGILHLFKLIFFNCTDKNLIQLNSIKPDFFFTSKFGKSPAKWNFVQNGFLNKYS